MENHGYYHPTYEMVAGMSLGDSLLMGRLADPAVAALLEPYAEHNVMQVWTNNLDDMVMDSGEFAYPSGLDWEMHDYEQNSYIAWMAAHFNDPLARWADNRLSQLVRQRQIINGNGMFVGPSVSRGSGDPFFREAVEARRTAIAWLHWAHADYPAGPTNAPATPNLDYFPDVGIIAHRSVYGFFGLSFGARVMAVLEPPVPVNGFPTNVFVATPRLPGMIGIGALGTPTSAVLVNYSTNAEGFAAELTLQYGGAGTTEVYIDDTGASVAIVEVPRPAGASATPAGSFDVGIENDPLTGGSRLIEWNGNSRTVTNRSGVSFNMTNGWVCVAGRYGMAAGPDGYFNYQAPAGYNRAGAAEDTLQYYPSDPLGPRYAVWFPGKNAIQTSNASVQISWHAAGTNAVLEFPGPGGAPRQLSVETPVPPPYPPYAVAVSGVSASSWQSSYPPTNAVDGNYSDFWASSGTSPGQGPTTNHPEWLRFTFPRTVAVSGFQVAPRTLNGGYGPKTLDMLLDNTAVYSGTMAPTSTLEVHLESPVDATNAELLITSSYDPAYPTNSRNVQVVEVGFSERAVPGTFGDWALQNFSDSQLSDPDAGYPLSDPDGDGAPNVLEFAMGGDPLAADPAAFLVDASALSGDTIGMVFRERNQLGDVQRQFQTSTDLANWSAAVPLQINVLTNFGEVSIKQALFPIQQTNAFYRIRYSY